MIVKKSDITFVNSLGNLVSKRAGHYAEIQGVRPSRLEVISDPTIDHCPERQQSYEFALRKRAWLVVLFLGICSFIFS